MTLEDILALRRQGAHEAARDALVALARARPDDGRVQFEAACVHDFLGEERAAVPYYEAALRLSLPPAERRSAYVGLGSTLRTLGEYDRSRAVLEEGLAHFPGAAELRAFLAMTRYNLGDMHAAVAGLLELVSDVGGDEGLNGYTRAIRCYAQDLGRRWD